MLIDIVPRYADRSRIDPKVLPTWDAFSPEEQAHLIPRRIQQGVWAGGLNPVYLCMERNLDEFIERRGNMLQLLEDHREAWDFYREEGHKFLSSYGVCDSVENLLEHPEYKDVLNDPTRKFTVFVCAIRKEDQSEEGGWRWHKWGPYIGEHTPQCEYLADEEGIEQVFVFQIVEHRDIPVAELDTTQ